MMEPYEETCYLWTRSEIRFRFTWERYSLRPVRIHSNSRRVSDRDEGGNYMRPVQTQKQEIIQLIIGAVYYNFLWSII